VDTREIFKPDRSQLIAVVAMLVAVFTFAAGELWIGGACFVLAAGFSLGGLFWHAHRADRAEAVAAKRAADAGDPPTPNGK
jgi:hypothetical protein